jgi:hypothetical protein
MPVRHGDRAYEKQKANSVSIESEFTWRTAKRVPPNCGARFFIAECFLVYGLCRFLSIPLTKTYF